MRERGRRISMRARGKLCRRSAKLAVAMTRSPTQLGARRRMRPIPISRSLRKGSGGRGAQEVIEAVLLEAVEVRRLPADGSLLVALHDGVVHELHALAPSRLQEGDDLG